MSCLSSNFQLIHLVTPFIQLSIKINNSIDAVTPRVYTLTLPIIPRKSWQPFPIWLHPWEWGNSKSVTWYLTPAGNNSKITTSLFINSMTSFQGHLLHWPLLRLPFALLCLQPSRWAMMSDQFLESREIASLVDADWELKAAGKQYLFLSRVIGNFHEFMALCGFEASAG